MIGFKEAINRMITDGEFEKIINGKGKYKWSEREKVKEWYGLIKDNKDFDKIPISILIESCRCYSVLQDVIVYMIAGDKNDEAQEIAKKN